tara:strand:- start:31 stop:747 length:717 start_codon:yes stop_codon:yes gene_type:complete
LFALANLTACTSLYVESENWNHNQKVTLYRQLGLGYMKQNRLSQSYESLSKALELSEFDSATNHAMALLSTKLNRNADARYYFKVALKTDSGNYDAQNDYGEFLCQNKDFKSGIQQFKIAINNPFNTSILDSQYGMGLCLLLSGNFLEAKRYLGQVLVFRPTDSDSLYYMAFISFHLNEYLSSRAFLERFFSANHISAESLLLAAKTERKLGHNNIALEYEDKLKEQYPANSQLNQIQ